MHKYSQNNEQDIILAYFGNTKGTFLDIGAHDGISLSNTRALVELGWDGVMVEANEEIFDTLKNNYTNSKNVHLINRAVGDSNGESIFYQNDTYYSTFSQTDVKRWVSDPNITFKEVSLTMVDFKSLMDLSPIKMFDFISLDIEGMEPKVLPQMDLIDLGCKCICIEWNGNNFDLYDGYLRAHGLRQIHSNAENLIYAV